MKSDYSSHSEKGVQIFEKSDFMTVHYHIKFLANGRKSTIN